MPKLLAKWQSLYDQRQIPAQTVEQYTDSYIADKLLPMWPTGWMKIPEIHSHLMPKTKDVKKSSNEHKTSKSQHPTINAPSLNVETVKDETMMAAAAVAAATASGAHNAEKRKSHSVKESAKMPKHNHDNTTLSKTDKKHHHITSDRSMATATTTAIGTIATTTSAIATSLLSMPLGDTYSSKPVRLSFTFSLFFISIFFVRHNFFPTIILFFRLSPARWNIQWSVLLVHRITLRPSQLTQLPTTAMAAR